MSTFKEAAAAAMKKIQEGDAKSGLSELNELLITMPEPGQTEVVERASIGAEDDDFCTRTIRMARIIGTKINVLKIDTALAKLKELEKDPAKCSFAELNEIQEEAALAEARLAASSFRFNDRRSRTLLCAGMAGLLALGITVTFGVTSSSWFVLAALLGGGLLGYYTPEIMTKLFQGRFSLFNVSIPANLSLFGGKK